MLLIAGWWVFVAAVKAILCVVLGQVWLGSALLASEGDWWQDISWDAGVLVNDPDAKWLQSLQVGGYVHFQSAFVDGEAGGKDFWYGRGADWRRVRATVKGRALDSVDFLAHLNMVQDDGRIGKFRERIAAAKLKHGGRLEEPGDEMEAGKAPKRWKGAPAEAAAAAAEAAGGEGPPQGGSSSSISGQPSATSRSSPRRDSTVWAGVLAMWPCAAVVVWKGWRLRKRGWAGRHVRARSCCASR